MTTTLDDHDFGAGLYAGIAPEADPSFFAPLWHVIGLAHLISTDLNRIAGRHGLSIADLLLLGALRIAGRPLRPTDLATQLHVSNAALTARITRLAGAGLIIRSPCPDDKRAFALTLTMEGSDSADMAIAQICQQGHFARHYRRLEQADRDHFAVLLSTLHDMMNRDFVPGHGASR